MGDRIAIQFEIENKEGTEKYSRSVALFHHWGGECMRGYVKEFNESVLKTRRGECDPLDRMEPNTIMVAFIAWLFRGPEKTEIPTHSFYLGVDGKHGDCSDQGNFIYRCAPDKGIVHCTKEREEYRGDDPNWKGTTKWEWVVTELDNPLPPDYEDEEE
jgi:hypothetical protein